MDNKIHLINIKQIITSDDFDNTKVEKISKYINTHLPTGKRTEYVCGACMTDPFGDCGCGNTRRDIQLSIDDDLVLL